MFYGKPHSTWHFLNILLYHKTGLYDPQALNTKNLKKFQFYVEFPDRFVQILHDGEMHWFTISNTKSTHGNQIQAYDSFYMNKTYINNQTFNGYLKKIIFPPSNEINNNHLRNKRHKLSRLNQETTNFGVQIKEEFVEIECAVESVQKQSDTVMCGLYAIAFALDLCQDIDPVYRHYDESKMREHLLKCLRQNYFEEFPQISDPSKYRACTESQIILIEM